MNAIVPAGGAHNLLPFPVIVRERLFDIYILLGLASPNGRQRVPVVARGDCHGVDVAVVEQLTQVRVFRGVRMRLAGIVEQFLVGIAERGDAHIGQLAELLQKFVATPTQADESDIELLIYVLRPDRRNGEGRTESGRLLQERAPMNS